MAHEVLRGTITALVVSRPAAMAAQEDAYLSCSEEVACYTASGCRRGSAGRLQLAMFDDGRRAVVEVLETPRRSKRPTETLIRSKQAMGSG